MKLHARENRLVRTGRVRVRPCVLQAVQSADDDLRPRPRRAVIDAGADVAGVSWSG